MGWAPLHPGARVAVLCPAIPDRISVTSTLPALADALTRLDRPATFLSAWDHRWTPGALDPPVHHPWWVRAAAFVRRSITREPDPLRTYTAPEGRLAHPFRGRDTPERAAAVDAAWWSALDLAPYDVVVAPGLGSGRRVLDHPSRRPGTRVIVCDHHMLESADRWKDGAGEHPDVVFTSAFPSFAHLYRAAGLRPETFLWRPYPLHLGHLRPARDPRTCATIFSGGRNGRAFDTLAAAARRLDGRIHPLLVHADPAEVAQVGAPLVGLGFAPLPQFVERLRTSRFAVVALRHEPHISAGQSVASLALAAGRPVVATDTPGMRDHLRDGVDALLVPPEDPEALADAILRLDTDHDLLHRLAQGALAAGDRLSVTTFAAELVAGAPVEPWPAAPRVG